MYSNWEIYRFKNWRKIRGEIKHGHHKVRTTFDVWRPVGKILPYGIYRGLCREITVISDNLASKASQPLLQKFYLDYINHIRLTRSSMVLFPSTYRLVNFNVSDACPMLPGRSLSFVFHADNGLSELEFSLVMNCTREVTQGHHPCAGISSRWFSTIKNFEKKFDSKILNQNWKIEKMENNFKKGNLKKFPSIVKLPGMRDWLTL